MNYARILANGLLSFFTTLAALKIAGIEEMQVALITAFIQAGLALATEMKKEVEGEGIGKVISSALVV